MFLLTLIAAGYFWLKDADSNQKKTIAYFENLTARLQSETVPIKFMILAREGGEIKARLKLYDLGGREIAVVEKSWRGSEIYVDMLLVPVRTSSDRTSSDRTSSKGASGAGGDSWLAFPYRIFTDQVSAASGTLLFDSYDSAGFPEVFRGVEWSQAERATISAAFSAARKSAAAGLPATDSARGSFGSAVHEASKLSRFDLGIVYKVVCRVKGGVEIVED
jgi:hypothetical protein